MKMRYAISSRRSLLFSLLTLVCCTVRALAGNFTIQTYGINPYHFGTRDVWSVTVINSGEARNLVLKVSLTGKNGQKVAETASEVISFGQGATLLNAMKVKVQGFTFYDKDIEQAEKQLHTFPAGSYQLCYQLVDPAAGTTEEENCSDLRLEVLTPPTAILPEDAALIESVYPVFSWTPQVPSAGVQYTLTVVQVNEGQLPLDAMLRNRPVLETRGIRTLSYVYPQGATKLQKGGTYAWQIKTDYQKTTDNPGDAMPASVSPVYSFTIKKDSLPEQLFMIPYAIMKKQGNDNTYLAYGQLKFIYYSQQPEEQLSVSVKNEKGKQVPLKEGQLKAVMGENKYEMDLGAYSLGENEVYSLELTNKAGEVYSLRFVFKYVR